MHYNKSYIYPTSHTPFNEIRPERYNQSRPTPVWIPTLDLAGLELDCDNENDQEDNCTATPKDTKPESGKDESHVLFVRKPKPSFVFPSDSSFAHLEKMKSRHQLRNDDDANIVSVDSYRNGVTTVDPLPQSIKTSGDQSQYDDQIISFSLRDHNLEKYLRFDYKDLEVVGHQDNVSKAIEPERSLEKQEKQIVQESRPSQFKEKLKGAKFDDVNNNLQCNQDVYEVIVVNGHLKSDAGSSQEGKQDDEVYHESNVDTEIAKGKSKPRVTFSFEENRTPRGSIKRYTPLKGEMHFQLQGVLKKRPPPSHISSYSSSSDDTNKREKLRNSKNYPENVKFSKSNYHLDHQSSLRVGLEHGIPVKHIHPTNADLEKKQSRISATDVVQKPPVASTRITLSMAAEKAAIGTSGRRTLTRSHNYSSAHTRGRMAYFRPADGGRTPGSSTGLRSKSTEDVRYQETKRLQSDCSSKSAKSHTLPFGLRRCASSDHDLLTGTGSKQKPPKPKIAFGSFILPKEAVCQSRNNQIKFHDDTKPASQGTYVHAHTRRSPYAAPAQLFLKENQKSEIQQRPLTAQIRQLPQQIIPAKELTHRHSAPSSYGQSRDKSFHSQKNVRLTINTSPARSQSMKTQMGLKATKPLTANVPTQSYLMRTTLPSGAQVSRVRKNVDFERPNRQNIAAMNMISRRDKGASHQRFVTKLQDYCNDVS